MKKVTFELDGSEYKIPQIITIGDYMKIYKVKGLFEEEYFASKLLSILTGAPHEKLLEADREKIDYLFTNIYEILPQGKPTFVDKFKLDDVEYGFIPSWKKMSFGEFADLDTLMTKKPEEMLDYLHIITAILYRPIIKSKSEHDFQIEKYNQESLEVRAELFENKLDVEYALGAQFFFTLFAEKYLNSTPISLRTWMSISWTQIKVAWRMRKTIWKALISRKGSVGILFLTEYLKMTLQDIQKLQRKP